jgi:hypothetical protein
MVVMALAVLAFFIVIALVSAFGFVADSRDSADWKPSFDGARAGNWH